MTWAPTELQKSIYTVLEADASLRTLLEGTEENPKIYDFIPDDTTYPYLRLDVKPMLDRGNHTLEGVAFDFTINTFYRAPGRGHLKVQTIQKRIDELIHKQNIAIDRWDVISLRRNLVDILTEPDNVTLHGVQVFRILLAEA